MIEEFDPHEFPGVKQVFGDVDILGAGCQLSGWMVMTENNRAGISQNRTLEYLPGRYGNFVNGTDADSFNPYQMITAREHDGKHSFPIGIDQFVLDQFMDVR